jgi:hypothetical protein
VDERFRVTRSGHMPGPLDPDFAGKLASFLNKPSHWGAETHPDTHRLATVLVTGGGTFCIWERKDG